MARITVEDCTEGEQPVTIYRNRRDREEILRDGDLVVVNANRAKLGIMGQDRDALADALDAEWNGALPHTLLIAPGGKIVYRHTGMIDPLEVKKAVVDYVGRYFFKP